ncbi:MAG: serine/threonine protein kinase [Armatimonadetes bacterium]|nr:serine/threonine protein kinase [Armatimonadota bacterium]
MNRRKVSVKALVTDQTLPPRRWAERFARYEREVRVGELVSCLYVLEVLDSDLEHEPPYIVYEYLEGETLLDLLDRSGSLPFKENSRIMGQVLGGLVSAHEKGVVHRDIRPENIVLGKGGYVKLTGFGLASFPGEKTLSVPIESWGASGYLSPEQFERGSSDAATDLWAVGVISYLIETGHMPFNGVTVEEIAVATLHQEPDWSSIENEDFEFFLKSMLRKDPAQRPPDALVAVALLWEVDMDDYIRATEPSPTRSSQDSAQTTPDRQPLTQTSPNSSGIGWIAAVMLLAALTLVWVVASGALPSAGNRSHDNRVGSAKDGMSLGGAAVKLPTSSAVTKPTNAARNKHSQEKVAKPASRDHSGTPPRKPSQATSHPNVSKRSNTANEQPIHQPSGAVTDGPRSSAKRDSETPLHQGGG